MIYGGLPSLLLGIIENDAMRIEMVLTGDKK